ncbi:hypothetical protein Bca52824_048286 [Brassica carinata]|uniref:Uncharacterized protein n=1 Tax=Brassica carinata TaxID=52824 RepID=A0A8X7RIN9_BRACI|nr:hypothetical protein Bca52824_048286 [Brassica carinata]
MSMTAIANVEEKFEQLRVSGQDQVNKKSSYRIGPTAEGSVARRHRLTRAGRPGGRETNARPRRAQLHGGIKLCKEMDSWHSDITVKLVSTYKKKKIYGRGSNHHGVGPPMRKRRTRAAKGLPARVGESRFQIVRTKLRIILG